MVSSRKIIHLPVDIFRSLIPSYPPSLVDCCVHCQDCCCRRWCCRRRGLVDVATMPTPLTITSRRMRWSNGLRRLHSRPYFCRRCVNGIPHLCYNDYGAQPRSSILRAVDPIPPPPPQTISASGCCPYRSNALALEIGPCVGL